MGAGCVRDPGAAGTAGRAQRLPASHPASLSLRGQGRASRRLLFPSPRLDGSSLLGIVPPACKSASCHGRRVLVLRGHRQPCLLIDTGLTHSHCQDPERLLSVFSLLPFWADFFFFWFGLLFYFQMAMTQPFPAALRVSWSVNRLFLGQ